jgi:hypothetical protein
MVFPLTLLQQGVYGIMCMWLYAIYTYIWYIFVIMVTVQSNYHKHSTKHNGSCDVVAS